MSDIVLLDAGTIDQIAAGEVIERPQSVVKELVENSLDAGAGAVTVEIKDGGLSFIRVTDNGAGIPKDQVSMAFARHATSKIRSAQDLLTVSSLGFRGEALSSISAVSRAEVITKTPQDITGVRYRIEGGQEVSSEEIGAPDGTTMIIRDLFFNTPARKKFMKSAQTEASYISSLTEKLALSDPDVSIRLIVNGQNRFHTQGSGRVMDLIYMIYGRDTASHLLEISYETETIRISGYIGDPSVSRGNRAYENFFVNGRYVQSSLLCRALEDGFGHHMMQHRYPFSVIYLQVEPELIDVNVHPTKREIRFKDQEAVYSALKEQTAAALSYVQNINDISLKPQDNARAKASAAAKRTAEDLATPQPSHIAAGYDSGNGPEQESGPAPEEKIKEPASAYIYHAEPFEKIRAAKENGPAAQKPAAEDLPGAQLRIDDAAFLREKTKAEYHFIGQAFKTYWMIEFRDELYIIDQHAAHEKVNYERMLRRLKEKQIYSQQIAPPMLLTLNMREEEVLMACLDVFSELGFEIAHFGGREYVVRSVPMNLYGISDPELFIQLLDSLTGDIPALSAEVILEKLASMSCKAAIKGGDNISEPEARALVDELMTLDDPYSCPHGRPTMIKLTKKELEKQFKRIV